VVVGVDKVEHSVGGQAMRADLTNESQVKAMYDRVHLARSGVRVNAVLFGPIETPAQRSVFDLDPGALDKRLVHWPMGRFGTLEEAAGAITFLASEDSGFITAAALPLDGGITKAFTVPE
jgi:enoyl-[acyl-carrier-protein] reductase (NADH)